MEVLQYKRPNTSFLASVVLFQLFLILELCELYTAHDLAGPGNIKEGRSGTFTMGVAVGRRHGVHSGRPNTVHEKICRHAQANGDCSEKSSHAKGTPQTRTAIQKRTANHEIGIDSEGMLLMSFCRRCRH